MGVETNNISFFSLQEFFPYIRYLLQQKGDVCSLFLGQSFAYRLSCSSGFPELDLELLSFSLFFLDYILSWIKLAQFLFPCVLIQWFAHTRVLGKKMAVILKHCVGLTLWREFFLLFLQQPQWKEVVVDVNVLNYWFMKRLYLNKMVITFQMSIKHDQIHLYRDEKCLRTQSFAQEKIFFLFGLKYFLFVCFTVAHPQEPHHPSEKPVIHCHKCGEPCKGEVLRVQARHFHIKCFTCKGKTLIIICQRSVHLCKCALNH